MEVDFKLLKAILKRRFAIFFNNILKKELVYLPTLNYHNFTNSQPRKYGK
jgi:hypothetical protein